MKGFIFSLFVVLAFAAVADAGQVTVIRRGGLRGLILGRTTVIRNNNANVVVNRGRAVVVNRGVGRNVVVRDVFGNRVIVNNNLIRRDAIIVRGNGNLRGFSNLGGAELFFGN